MPIFIYNSLARKKQEFIPLNPPKVNIYTCGVTVYDESHIGHARSLYIFEVIRRYLTYRGFKVKFVRNITDIDDKIINRARELKVDWKELVKKYIARYSEDLELLGIEKGDSEPRATENIEEMVKHIQGLIDRGFAYESGGDVYFNVRKFPNYGKLSGQSIDQMEKGVRIEPSEFKRDPLDFALWKKSKPDEPFWQSPWSQGRPGWHIECSVMAQKFLKTETLDIHAGGRDLIFPHHENEIAQSEALTGKAFAKYWIHHGLLTINGQKMAKSLGNFVTIKDVLKDYPDTAAADILKVFFLQVHYSTQIDFSQNKMEEVKSAVYNLLKVLDHDFGIKDLTKLDSEEKKNIDVFKVRFEESMDDDFNTPRALGEIFSLARHCNNLLAEYNEGEMPKLQYAIQYTIDTIRELGGILGLSLNKIDPKDPKWLDLDLRNTIHEVFEEVGNIWIQDKINERAQLKKEKKYAEADEIRKMLYEKGIILEDTKEGTTWRRKL